MLSEYHNALDRLGSAGWTVHLQTTPQSLPSIIENRFSWIPAEVKQLIMELQTAVSPDETAWLLGTPDYLNSSSSAFKWNEWELMSLDAVQGKPTLERSIQRFWDFHFPVANSVKSGYAYFAVRQADFCIVCGEEPEFEEPKVVASSFLELLRLLAKHDAKLSRWL